MVEWPRDCVIKISKDEVMLEIKKDGLVIKTLRQQLGEEYPCVKMIKKTHTMFELWLDKDKSLRINSKSNS